MTDRAAAHVRRATDAVPRAGNYLVGKESPTMKSLPTCVATLAFCCAAAAQVPAEADSHRLKTAYLVCDEQATQTMLDFGEAARCSQIAEALLKQVFDGDFERLLQWWRVAKAERVRLAASGR
jgi:hypothetical protein